MVTELRARITRPQREILDRIWNAYRSTHKPLPRRVLDQALGSRAQVLAALKGLSGSVLYTTSRAGDHPPSYCLTLLGALLSDQGDRIEEWLTVFLGYVRQKLTMDPAAHEITSQELSESHIASGDAAELIACAMRLPSLRLNWGGSYNSNRWSFTIPDDVDSLLAAPNISLAVRLAASEGFDESRPIDESEIDRRATGFRERSIVGFEFMRIPTLRQQTWTDWQEAQRAGEAGLWKACTVLCGAVMEGLLFDAVQQGAPGAMPQQGAAAQAPKLRELLRTAEERGILKGGFVDLGHALREFRNLIHPERQLALGVTVSEHEAQVALSFVQILIRELTAHATHAQDG
jgi:hypothetical protein